MKLRQGDKFRLMLNLTVNAPVIVQMVQSLTSFSQLMTE